MAQKHSDSKKSKHFDHENKNSGLSSIKRIKTGESSESIAIGWGNILSRKQKSLVFINLKPFHIY